MTARIHTIDQMDTPHTDTRSRLIAAAGLIALAGNLLLAAVKLSIGFAAHSLAVLGDGIDSATDVCIALMAVAVSRIIARPSDKEHPWGHGRAETTATMILSFIIFFAGAQLLLQSAQALATGSYTEYTSPLVIIAAAVSIAGKCALAAVQRYLGKKAQSPMILANAQNMKNDIIMSAGVLAGIAAAKLFGRPELDPVIALAVSLWIIKNAVSLFGQMNTELMDGNTDNELYRTLFAAIRSVPGVSHPHRARIRKIANHWDIDVDIEVDANMTVHQAHEIAERTAAAVKRAIPDVYDIMVHIEPAGHASHHPEEQYGLSEADVEREATRRTDA